MFLDVNYDSDRRWSSEAKNKFISILKINQVFTVSKVYFEVKTGHFKVELRNNNGKSFNSLFKNILNRK